MRRCCPTSASLILWAHAQLHGPDISDDHALAQALDNQPHYFSSRILSLNILKPETEYTAYLVPAFEAGRLAGLGLDNTGVAGMKPAWTAGAGTVSLPIFYQWSFETGPQGDFASLVRKIHPKPLAPQVGFREMDVATPGLGLPPAADTALPVEGALKRYPEIVSPPQTGPTHDTWLQDLTKLLNEPARVVQDRSNQAIGDASALWALACGTAGSRSGLATVVPGLERGSAHSRSGWCSPPWRYRRNSKTFSRERGTRWAQVRAANERARWTELAVEISSRLHEKMLVVDVDRAARHADALYLAGADLE